MLKIKIQKLITPILAIVLLFSLFGCGKGEKHEASNDEIYTKAIAILDEFGDDQRIIDFREAYDLLTSLPSNKNKFISQLEEVNEIYEKYDVKLKYGEWFLQPYLPDNYSERIDRYISESSIVDAGYLLEAIVYPVLFEKYGSEAHCIKGITAENVISAIKSTNTHSLVETKEIGNTTKEEWEYFGYPKTKYEVTYHRNGLVERVNIPIMRSNPLNDDDIVRFAEYDIETQKRVLGERIKEMQSRLDTISIGYDVLSQIYTDEEINIISNYIRTLTLDEIWERNLLSQGAEPATYFASYVYFNYKDNIVCIEMGLSNISLNIIGKNRVNPLSNRWYTLYCGLCLAEDRENTRKSYSDYINNDLSVNNTVEDFSFDLDAAAEDFAEVTETNLSQTQDNESILDVQQSIPVEMSISDSITVSGTLEQNDTAFPTYRLRLSPKLTFIFNEYFGEKVFDCEYIYFYDDTELNGYFPFEDFVGYSCDVTATLEDYRGDGELFFLNPTFSNVIN